MGFSALRRHESQQAEYNAYKAWLAKTADQKQALYAGITDETKRAKPERANGFISPFNQTGTALKHIKTRVLSADQTGQAADVALSLRTAINSYYLDDGETAPAGGAISIPRFKAARLGYTVKTTFTKKNSRITGRAYLKPDIDTVSAPFGQSTGGQTFAQAIALIEVAATTWKNAATLPAKRSFKIYPEGI